MPRQNCEVRLRRARLAAFAPDPTHVLMITHLTEEVRWIDHLTIVPKDRLKAAFDQRQSYLFISITNPGDGRS